MINLSLKQLRYFDALVRHGHFGRAAEASAISQPALSVQIREMEEELGTKLFERGARQVRLTGLGELIAPRVRDILRSLDELGDVARATGDLLAGTLRIGVIPTIAPYLLPRLLERLSASHPDLDLRIRETMTSTLLRELSDGRLDAAIAALPVSEAAMTEVPLLEEKFLLVRPAADEKKPVPSAEEVGGLPLLLLEEGHCFRDQAMSFCKVQSALPRERLDASSLSTLVQMVAAGMGVTLIPEIARSVETRSAHVSVARLKGPQPSRTIGMIWRKTNPLAERLEEVSEIVRDAAASIER